MNHYTIGILSHNISMCFSSGPQPDSSHNFHSFNDVLCTDVAPAGFLPTSQVGGWSLEQFRWGHCPLLCHRSLLGRCTQGESCRDEGWWTGIQHGDLQVTMRPWNMLYHGPCYWLVTSERLFSNTARTVYLSCNGLLLVFFGVAFKVLNWTAIWIPLTPSTTTSCSLTLRGLHLKTIWR